MVFTFLVVDFFLAQQSLGSWAAQMLICSHHHSWFYHPCPTWYCSPCVYSAMPGSCVCFPSDLSFELVGDLEDLKTYLLKSWSCWLFPCFILWHLCQLVVRDFELCHEGNDLYLLLRGHFAFQFPPCLSWLYLVSSVDMSALMVMTLQPLSYSSYLCMIQHLNACWSSTTLYAELNKLTQRWLLCPMPDARGVGHSFVHMEIKIGDIQLQLLHLLGLWRVFQRKTQWRSHEENTISLEIAETIWGAYSDSSVLVLLAAVLQWDPPGPCCLFSNWLSEKLIHPGGVLDKPCLLAYISCCMGLDILHRQHPMLGDEIEVLRVKRHMGVAADSQQGHIPVAWSSPIGNSG